MQCREIDAKRIRDLGNLIAIEVQKGVSLAPTPQRRRRRRAKGAEIYSGTSARGRTRARLLLFSCRSRKVLRRDLLKSDNEARKARTCLSSRDAFRANSLERQVVSVPDVRRRHSAELLHFDLGLITVKFLRQLWENRDKSRWLKIQEDRRKVIRRVGDVRCFLEGVDTFKAFSVSAGTWWSCLTWISIETRRNT